MSPWGGSKDHNRSGSGSKKPGDVVGTETGTVTGGRRDDDAVKAFVADGLAQSVAVGTSPLDPSVDEDPELGRSLFDRLLK